MNKFNFAFLFFTVILFSISCETTETDDPDDDQNTDTRLTDSRDGRVYNTVKIGTQTWMAENLKYLPAIYSNSEYSYTEPRYYVYDFSGTNPSAAKMTSNFQTYGVLYNWPAANNSCPSGWHLPSDAEWETLAQFIDSDNGNDGKFNDDWNSVGTYLKSQTGWTASDSPVNDKYGFKALPGGYRDNSITFNAILNHGLWWSATAQDGDNAFCRSLSYFTASFSRVDNRKDFGFSVRCIKN